MTPARSPHATASGNPRAAPSGQLRRTRRTPENDHGQAQADRQRDFRPRTRGRPTGTPRTGGKDAGGARAGNKSNPRRARPSGSAGPHTRRRTGGQSATTRERRREHDSRRTDRTHERRSAGARAHGYATTGARDGEDHTPDHASPGRTERPRTTEANESQRTPPKKKGALF